MQSKLKSLAAEVNFYSSHKKENERFTKLTTDYERRMRDSELLYKKELRKVNDQLKETVLRSDFVSTSTNIQSPISKRISY